MNNRRNVTNHHLFSLLLLLSIIKKTHLSHSVNMNWSTNSISASRNKCCNVGTFFLGEVLVDLICWSILVRKQISFGKSLIFDQLISESSFSSKEVDCQGREWVKVVHIRLSPTIYLPYPLISNHCNGQTGRNIWLTRPDFLLDSARVYEKNCTSETDVAL